MYAKNDSTFIIAICRLQCVYSAIVNFIFVLLIIKTAVSVMDTYALNMGLISNTETSELASILL